MLGSGARLVTCVRQFNLQSRCASTCSATNEVCQYYYRSRQNAAVSSWFAAFALASYATAASYHGIWLAGPELIWV